MQSLVELVPDFGERAARDGTPIVEFYAAMAMIAVDDDAHPGLAAMLAGAICLSRLRGVPFDATQALRFFEGATPQ